MGVRLRKPMRMAGADVAAGIAIRRRGLRQPRRITDRAEIDGRHVNVIANRLEPLEDGLPLLPIQLAQKRAQSLDEGILEQSFAVGFRDEETVQADVEGLGYFLQCPEARSHLAAFDAREVGARDLRARLQLALGHAARFTQLANALADVLDRLLVDEFFRRRFGG